MISQFWIERMSLQTPVWSDLISLYPTVNDICQSTSHVDPSPYMSIMHHFHCWQLSIPNAHDNRSCDYAPKKQRAFICSTASVSRIKIHWNLFFSTYFILTEAAYFSREALEIGNTSCAVTGTKSSIRRIPVNHMTLLSVV